MARYLSPAKLAMQGRIVASVTHTLLKGATGGRHAKAGAAAKSLVQALEPRPCLPAAGSMERPFDCTGGLG